jgi:hypothetical protein
MIRKKSRLENWRMNPLTKLLQSKKLMERRESFEQSSVPNAHKGYSGTPPIVMLLIVSAFIVVSLIFATAAIVN